MRNRVAERFAPTELLELRAAAEAKPARNQQVRRPYPGCSVDALAVMRAADTTPAALGMRQPVAPSRPQPIVLTDWSARLGADFADIDRRFTLLTAAVKSFCETDLDELLEALAPFADAVKAEVAL